MPESWKVFTVCISANRIYLLQPSIDLSFLNTITIRSSANAQLNINLQDVEGSWAGGTWAGAGFPVCFTDELTFWVPHRRDRKEKSFIIPCKSFGPVVLFIAFFNPFSTFSSSLTNSRHTCRYSDFRCFPVCNLSGFCTEDLYFAGTLRYHGQKIE